VAKTLHCRGS